jgi:hypothetical protein
LTGTALPAAADLVAFAVAAAALATVSWLAGRWATRRLLPVGPLGHALALAVGLVLVAQALFALAWLGALRPAVLLVALAGLALLAWLRRGAAAGFPATPGWSSGEWWAAAILVASAVLLASYPPTGFDETTYHLPMARAFAESGHLPVMPELRYPVFPALFESLAAGLWLLGGERATHAGSQLAVLATAALLLARGIEEGKRGAGWLAAALFLGSPLAVYLGASGYVEPLLALCVTAATLCVERAQGHASTGWLVLAGLFAGSAAASKYLGLLALAFVGGDVLWVARRRPRGILLFAAAALLAAAPTYARIAMLTGNPVFPFFSRVFGATPWAADSFLGPRGLARLAAAATSLWDAAFRRSRIGSMVPLSPALPLLLPLLAWGAVRVARARRWALLVLTYLLAAPVAAHYLLMVIPSCAVAIGEGLDDLLGAWRARRPGRRSLAGVVALLFSAPTPAYAASWVWRFGWPPATRAGREAYLERRSPYLELTHALERRVGPRYTIVALHAEELRYHLRGRVVGEQNGPASYARIVPDPPDAAALADRLRQLGVDHLLLPAAYGPVLGGDDDAIERSFERVGGNAAATLYRVREP